MYYVIKKHWKDTRKTDVYAFDNYESARMFFVLSFHGAKTDYYSDTIEQCLNIEFAAFKNYNMTLELLPYCI